jgi:hypothetical protein
MAIVECFMLISTDKTKRGLRRYRSGDKDKCPGPMGYHNAIAQIEDGLFIPNERGYLEEESVSGHINDQRWPTKCVCGYVFAPEDEWQIFIDHWYMTPSGEKVTLSDAPPGAMWFANWFLPHWQGPDGHCLCVMLPDGGEWCIDGPSNNGPGWTRTGVPPNVTVAPSILTDKYHGMLENGKLRSV